MSFDIEPPLTRLLSQLAATAAERDRAGGHPAHERELLRESGLLTLAVPRRFGGLGQDWQTILGAVRRIAAVDSSLAHLFAFQHLQVASILLFGDEQQQADLLTRTVEKGWFWGNALNPADNRSRAVYQDDGVVIHGLKSFCSGARGADVLLISAHDDNGKFLIGAIPADREGITINDDWDAIGQRQTDSGTVRFDNVHLAANELLRGNNGNPLGTPYATLRACLAQSILTNIYLGLAQGAFDTARSYTLENRRPWINSGIDTIAQDPYLQHRFAELWLKLRPAILLADVAADKLDQAWQLGLAITPEERGEVALAVLEAKVFAHRASLDIGNQLFDVAGAGATRGALALDRFWRNARTHTLHDPIDYKLRDLGNWVLTGTHPTPTSYS